MSKEIFNFDGKKGLKDGEWLFANANDGFASNYNYS